MIQLESVSKTFLAGEIEVQALIGVDLYIGCGECVATMGPSGSGNSTMMNMLGCLDLISRDLYQRHRVDVADRVVRLRDAKIVSDALSRTPAGAHE